MEKGRNSLERAGSQIPKVLVIMAEAVRKTFRTIDA